jgi:hypothetical protein
MRRVSPTMTAPKPMLAKPSAPKPATAIAVASKVDRRGKNPDMQRPRMMCQWPVRKTRHEGECAIPQALA